MSRRRNTAAFTLARLKSLLQYDPNTGVFKWAVDRGNRIKAGSVAGSLRFNGYLAISIDWKRYYSHRLAYFYMYGVMPLEIDHINGIRDDNRIVNLREVTRLENSKNSSKSRKNTSGHVGVTWSKECSKWLVQIRSEHITHYLGVFSKLDDAISARKAAEERFGFHRNHGKPNRRKVGGR